MNYANVYSPKETKQIDKVPGRQDQVKNNAGGYVFEIDDMMRARRFLILGSEGNTYYQSAKTLTIENATIITNLIEAGKGKELIDLVVEISSEGIARKNEPAIFVLALCLTFGDNHVKQYTIDNFTKVIRIGTHLFQFAHTIRKLRGWGRCVKRCFEKWYMEKNVDKLAFQVIKYQGRTIEGGKKNSKWTHRDLLRLNHFKTKEKIRDQLFNYLVNGFDKNYEYKEDLCIIGAFEAAKLVEKEETIINLIINYGLTREMIPTKFLNKPKVQETLFEKMGMIALVRSLAQFTMSGLIDQYNTSFLNRLESKLTNVELIKKSKIHPLQILDALFTYNSGQSLRGSGSWNPVGKVADLLNDMFYESFRFIEPTGKKIMLACDVSGSMTCDFIANSSITPMIFGAVLAMTTMKVEKDYIIKAFSHNLQDLNISPNMTLDQVDRVMGRLDFGSTDCSLPMLDAINHNCKDIDAFVIYTDNETWAGDIQPFQALQKYRAFSGNNKAKLITIGLTSTGFTIADPTDNNMFDIVGGGTDTPRLISDFISEKI